MLRNPDISGLLLVVQAPIDKDVYLFCAFIVNELYL